MGKRPTNTQQFMDSVGAQLRAAREAKGYSLRYVGSELDVSHGAVGHWEKGINPVDLETLHRLSELYGVSMMDLLAGEITAAQAARAAEVLHAFHKASQALPASEPRKRHATGA